METRVCNTCDVEKELTKDNFQPQPTFKSGFNFQCKVCRSAYFIKWRTENKTPDYLRKKALKELYHTTIEWYEEKLAEQEGHCALCDKKQQAENSMKRLSVDHDHAHCPRKHACGNCNRGLLCFNCNKLLGHLEFFRREVSLVSPVQGSWTSRALAYLKSYERTQV